MVKQKPEGEPGVGQMKEALWVCVCVVCACVSMYRGGLVSCSCWCELHVQRSKVGSNEYEQLGISGIEWERGSDAGKAAGRICGFPSFLDSKPQHQVASRLCHLNQVPEPLWVSLTEN